MMTTTAIATTILTENRSTHRDSFLNCDSELTILCDSVRVQCLRYLCVNLSLKTSLRLLCLAYHARRMLPKNGLVIQLFSDIGNIIPKLIRVRVRPVESHKNQGQARFQAPTMTPTGYGM